MGRGPAGAVGAAVRGLGLGLALVLGACAGVGGCSSGDGPRIRLGSIPFPGAFTLYTVADPAALGEHRYEPWWDRGPEAVSRGIIYTRRAGFLDVAHVRDSMDWTRYTHGRALEAICRGQGTFGVECDQARFEADVRYPSWWCDLGGEERRALAEEWAVKIGERMSVVIGTWHEIATWHGLETVPPISERPSAFTWDDAASPAVGAMAGGRALRSGEPDWDRAATAALNAVLAELGAMAPGAEDEAVRRVKGRWWYDGLARRRDLDTGLETGWKRPWLVEGMDEAGGGAGEVAEGVPVTDLGDVLGRDMRGYTEMRVVPRPWLLRAATGRRAGPKWLSVPGGVLEAIERVRVELREDLGPGADQP